MCITDASMPPLAPAPAASVTAGDLTLVANDGARFAAYAAAAAPGTAAAAVVVLPDLRGLHRFYKDLVLRLAETGLAAVAIDYYGRSAGIGARTDEFPFMQHVLHLTRAGLQADLAAAIAFLRSAADGGYSSVFTLGFCMGGRLSFLAPAHRDDLAGAIGFYGAPGMTGPYRDPGPTQLAGRITAPVLALMGGADEGIPPEEVTAFDAALTAAGVEHEVVVYPGAPHGFFDLQHAAFAEVCADAWQRTLAFIGRYAQAPRPGRAGAGTEPPRS